MEESGKDLQEGSALGISEALRRAREKQKELLCAFIIPVTLLMKTRKVKVAKSKLQGKRSQNQIMIRDLGGLGGEGRLESQLTKTESFAYKGVMKNGYRIRSFITIAHNC